MWLSTMCPRNFPLAGNEVLLVVDGKRVISGFYVGYNGAHHIWKSGNGSFTYWDNEITHWMPLPEPPKER